MRPAERGVWLSVDGVEAAGKTTLVDALHVRLPTSVVVNEFTDDPVGRFLREMVKVHPHVFSESRVGQSLVFLAEFWQRFDFVVRSALGEGVIVLSDRGYLSKYVYQHVVMEPAIGRTATQALLLAVLGPMPAPAMSVVLSAPIEVVIERLLARGETCDDARIRFIEAASEMFSVPAIAAGDTVFFDTSVQSPDEIAESVLTLLRDEHCA